MINLTDVRHDLEFLEHELDEGDADRVANKLVSYEAILLFEMSKIDSRDPFWPLIELIQSIKAKYGRKVICTVYETILDQS